MTLQRTLMFCSVFGIMNVCAGCATIVHGGDQQITIASNPTGATVAVDGSGSYKTPTQAKLARKKDHILVFTKDGYEQQNVTLMHVVSGAVAGNIIAGGLIGWGVDALTGAQFRLVPESVNVELRPLTATSTATSQVSQELTIEQRLKRLDELHGEKLVTDEEYKAQRILILQTLNQSPPAAATPSSIPTTPSPSISPQQKM